MKTCEKFIKQFAEQLAGQLEGDERLAFEKHLEECTSCRTMYKDMRNVSNRVQEIPEERTGDAMRERFYSMLETEKDQIRSAGSPRQRINRWLNLWWPTEPAVQLAVLTGAFIAAFFLGGAFQNVFIFRHQFTDLRQEIQDLRQTVSVSFLDKPSAFERLRGVQLIEKMEQPSELLVDKLFDHINRDPNTNVRLAAVDAIYLFSDHPDIDQMIYESLGQQDSPLVQIALIDLISAIREKNAVDALRKIIREYQLNPDVQEHAERCLQQML